jgi:GDP-L-fucose synthase
MKVFFTGGSGFFGRVLKKKFEDGGHNVVAPRSSEVNLLNGPEVDQAVKEASPDIVVNSAAYYGGIDINQKEPDNLFHINTMMIANIYHAAAKAEVPKVQGIGSACAYPAKTVGDLHEDDFWEGELHHSVVAYGFSKKLQEIAMMAYGKKYGMKGQLPLLTNLYGEHDVFTEYRSHVVSALIKRYADAEEGSLPFLMNWGTGSPIREFMYVKDTAEACYRLAMTDYEGRLNIGTGIGTTIKELAELTAKHTGFSGEVRWDPAKPDGVERKVLDVERMKRILEWSPPTDLDSGLKNTIEWYLANKEEADARE